MQSSSYRKFCSCRKNSICCKSRSCRKLLQQLHLWCQSRVVARFAVVAIVVTSFAKSCKSLKCHNCCKCHNCRSCCYAIVTIVPHQHARVDADYHHQITTKQPATILINFFNAIKVIRFSLKIVTKVKFVNNSQKGCTSSVL